MNIVLEKPRLRYDNKAKNQSSEKGNKTQRPSKCKANKKNDKVFEELKDEIFRVFRDEDQCQNDLGDGEDDEATIIKQEL